MMKCCICGKKLGDGPIGYYDNGNNPFPYDTTPGARCCNDCNIKHVIPARIADIHSTPAIAENHG